MPLRHAKLHDRVCLEARGPESAAFLHAQLSCSVLTLGAAVAPLAGWADARGRVRALFRVVRLPDRWLLVTPREGADALLGKLRMFVLRAKVTLARADDVAVLALLGDAADALERRGVAADTLPNRMVRVGDLSFVRIGPRYWQVLGAPAALEPLVADSESADAAAANRAEIELGIPAITPPSAERFVAQMLNLDELGAISYDKGCYPGQEIIARVRNLGGVKRRARRYAAPGSPPAAGAPVLGDGAQPVGETVCAAGAPRGCELLAVVDHAAAGGALTCGGAPLTELPLPFTVPLD
jgi:folate-binding protein YgfZ